MQDQGTKADTTDTRPGASPLNAQPLSSPNGIPSASLPPDIFAAALSLVDDPFRCVQCHAPFSHETRSITTVTTHLLSTAVKPVHAVRLVCQPCAHEWTIQGRKVAIIDRAVLAEHQEKPIRAAEILPVPAPITHRSSYGRVHFSGAAKGSRNYDYASIAALDLYAGEQD